MHADSGIPVRRSMRHEIVLPVRLAVVAPQRRHVQFAHGVADQDGCVPADLIDLSEGGCGVLSTHFFPKSCKVRMRVYGLEGTAGPTLLDGHVRVQRTTMTDTRPGYLLGLSFLEGDAVFDRDLEQLLHRLNNDDDAPNPGHGEAA
ncbi:MAG: PilZ domain-containing protein [Phycisphaeraceae bacterium]|nr:MAG: PilZ domain-containing protein [Phycisphaeraceae bacterium]